MENSTNTLSESLSEVFQGTNKVPEVTISDELLNSTNTTVATELITTNEIQGSNMTHLPYYYQEVTAEAVHNYETIEAVLVPNKEDSDDIFKEVVATKGIFSLEAFKAYRDNYSVEDERIISPFKSIVPRKAFHYPDVIEKQEVIKLSIQAQNALDKLLSTVNTYSEDDWKAAYKKIDYEVGKAKPKDGVRDVCISNEIFEIAQRFSWDYIYDMGDSYIYNGAFWVTLEQKQVLHFMRDISIKMGIKKYEAKAAKFGENLYKEVIYSGNLSRNVKPTSKLLLNMKNGTLHVSNDQIALKEHDKQDYLKYQLVFDYNANVVNQQWLQFLDDILPDKETQKTLQQSLGSLFLRGMNLNKMVLLYGTGANGKSVIFDVINGLLGQDLVSNYSLNSLTEAKGYHRAQIKDKLINYASDIDLSKIDIGMMKTLASGEAIECRLPYKEPFIMEDYAKCVFNLNDISTAKIEKTEGFYRRFMFVPFNVTIPENKQDKMLAKKLLNNKAGILNWLLDGAVEVLKSGSIYECRESQDFMLKFREQPTPFEKFLLNYQVKSDMQNTILSSELYEHYIDMCEKDNAKAVSQISFSKQLERQGYKKRDSRSSKGVQWQISLTS